MGRLSWVRGKVGKALGALSTLTSLLSPFFGWPYWPFVAAGGLLVAWLLFVLPWSIDTVRRNLQPPVAVATPATPADTPQLAASFTEMVQLIPLEKGGTFHGFVKAVDQQTTLVFTQIVVRNDGSPSIADDWTMWITVNGRDIKADGVPVTDFEQRASRSSPGISYKQEEAIYNVGVTRPVTRELPIRGFYIGRFMLGLEVVEHSLDSLRMRYVDGLGREQWTAPKKRGVKRPDWEVVPGIGKIVPP